MVLAAPEARKYGSGGIRGGDPIRIFRAGQGRRPDPARRLFGCTTAAGPKRQNTHQPEEPIINPRPPSGDALMQEAVATLVPRKASENGQPIALDDPSLYLNREL